ncbi:hypothetical protein Ddye_012298 [Dipteronia dyeriana]|uniref:Uncharacterized protein n=1 Tax=Dipteronia dyeriana TaxID=168575 RepID=A0AAD9X463_9ROSI|nr:hypothetical protein Ddye_012298 [Dipteronia dyeriana]
MNAKITMEFENKRELLGHPNLYKKAPPPPTLPLPPPPPPSLSMVTPDNEIMWWERLLQSGEFVQETPATTSMRVVRWDYRDQLLGRKISTGTNVCWQYLF